MIYFFAIKTFFNFFLECWNNEPDNRPMMNKVVAILKSIIAKTNKIKNDQINLKLSNEQTHLNDYDISAMNDLTNGESSQVKDLNMIIDEMVDFIFKEENNGIGSETISRHQHVFDYFNGQNIALQEIFNWLSSNQNDSNSIFLLGYFNYYGIETSKDKKKAFELFIEASKQNHILAQHYVRFCY